MEIAWRDGMRELSGFATHSADGKRYEECCRAMLVAGARWLAENPDAKPEFTGFEGVFGIVVPANKAAKDIEKVITDAAESLGGATGAMMHMTVTHLRFIQVRGWEAYVKQMTDRGGWIELTIAHDLAEIARLRELAPGTIVPCRYQKAEDHGPHCWCGGRKVTREEAISDLESEIEILEK